MLTNNVSSFLRRLLLPAAVVGALAFGTVASERTAAAQEVGVEVMPVSPGYGYTWAPGYWARWRKNEGILRAPWVTATISMKSIWTR